MKTLQAPLLFSLEGKVALVTGGGVNIGRGISRTLAEAGAKVLVAYHSSSSAAEKTVQEINNEGGLAEAFRVDVSDEKAVEALFGEILKKEGALDILVNNSGILSLSEQSELTVAEWDRIFGINARGVFLCCREAAKNMHPGAAIINVASINAIHPGFGKSAHYDATKGAVAAYTRSLAAELGPAGIRVNAVAPGLIDSPQLRKRVPELVESVVRRSPLGRLSLPEDIGAGVLFLASRASGNITGQLLVIDGGYLLS